MMTTIGSSSSDQQNAGKSKGGLWNYEIDKFMKKYPNFKGTYALDQINKIPLKKNQTTFSFIMNTEPIGVHHGHWIALFIKPNCIMYFDSFAVEPSFKFKHSIKKLLPSDVYQLKINRVKRQNVKTDTCGYHAMKFLSDIYSGKSFMEATGFDIIDKSIKGEKEIEKFKKMVKQFGYVTITTPKGVVS
eukprot:Lithocolla_globosa_v1_NODE_2344_length_2038_cov_7.138973.p2 type:complete len:188 gc:universal NODE_2344_length_2038_cov_7.138973:1594-1031(-)